MPLNDSDESLDPRFPILRHACYLNHAALAPLPGPARAAVAEIATESSEFGSVHYKKWLRRERETRQLAAALLGADSPADIALLQNTSTGLSLLAQGLRFTAGSNIVIPADDFPSTRLPWLALAERQAIELREVDILNAEDPEQAILNTVDKQTRLLAIASVNYATGMKLDLTRIGNALPSSCVFCVDAIQQLGALPIDVKDCRIDVLSAGGHKWLLSAEGTAIFYTTPELRNELALSQHGWAMVDNKFDFSRKQWEPSKSARRFEAGSPNNLGLAALNASLNLITEETVPVIESRLLASAAYLRDAVASLPNYRVLSPSARERMSGIVSIGVNDGSAPALFRSLLDDDIYAALRGNGLRVSPAFYTPQSHCDYILNRLQDWGQ